MSDTPHDYSGAVLDFSIGLEVICSLSQMVNAQTDSDLRKEIGHELHLAFSQQIFWNHVGHDQIVQRKLSAFVEITAVNRIAHDAGQFCTSVRQDNCLLIIRLCLG